MHCTSLLWQCTPGANAGGVRVRVAPPQLLEEVGPVIKHPVQRIPLRQSWNAVVVEDGRVHRLHACRPEIIVAVQP